VLKIWERPDLDAIEFDIVEFGPCGKTFNWGFQPALCSPPSNHVGKVVRRGRHGANLVLLELFFGLREMLMIHVGSICRPRPNSGLETNLTLNAERLNANVMTLAWLYHLQYFTRCETLT
jgi:hypothetical protein